MLTEPDFVKKKVIIIFSKNGDKISFKNDNIIVTDIYNNTKVQLSCWNLFSVFIVGGFNVTTGIIERSKRFRIFNSIFYCKF